MMIGKWGWAMSFFDNDNVYIAIIGDIKESKKISDRRGAQNTLIYVLKEINEKYKNDIASKFMITLGDEFQGLLYSGAHVINIISEIKNSMYPVKIRFGIGIGAITTDINHEMPIGADGPGYYKARMAVEFLKDHEKKKQAIQSDIRLEMEEDSQFTVTMINTILSLMNVIEEGWSERQREVILDMLEHQDSQENVAVRKKITQSSVQKNLSGGEYYAYKNAMDTVSKVLGEIRG